VVALVWANTPARDAYESLWMAYVKVEFGSVSIEEDLRRAERSS
jgi:hypothetical protein